MSGKSEPVLAPSGGGSSLEGRTVGAGRFQVRAELGRGGMGEVYRAFDRRRGREVALKVIAARYVGRPERERRFRNEAEYAQRVGEHPHVLSVMDVGELSDCGRRLFMTMDAVEGPTLAMELASSRRLSVDLAMLWARQIAEGLKAIHEAGVVHRDLTPSNILIQTGTNAAKIFDFGLAGELDAPATGHTSRLTLLGEVPGTHGYMAPEQATLAAPAMSMDVYAFGVVLTEMLVGHNPFAHLDRAEYIEWQQTSRDEVPSIKRWGLELPEGMADLIDDCLRRDAKERPQSGAELLARLDRIVPAPRVVDVVSLPSPVAFAEDDADDEPDTLRTEVVEPAPRRPWLIFALLASLLVVTGIGVGWWLATTVQETEQPEAQPSPPDEGAGSEALPTDEPLVEVQPLAPSAGSDDAGAAGNNEPPERSDMKEEQPAPLVDRPPDPGPQPPSQASATSCETRRKRARDAAQRKLWKTVLGSTQSARCWPDEAERRRLRVQALAETKQNAECVRIAADSSDPEIVKWRTRCEQGLWRPAP